MQKKYLATAALAVMLSLSACGGKPANQQAAEDAQKINLEAMIPQLSSALTEECSGGSIDVSCPAQRAQDLIKSFPAFRGVIAQYEKKCPQAYSASMCAQGYSNYLADELSGRLAAPVAAKAADVLRARKTELARQAEEEARAKAAEEEAARKAKEEADAAAQKAADEAKSAEDNAKAAEDAAHDAVAPAPEHNAPAADEAAPAHSAE